MEIKVTERGWGAHLCVSEYCLFRRNTLLEKGRKKIVVSTVGNYRSPVDGRATEIGVDRYYETMVFEAKYEKPYWEADVEKELDFANKWSLSEIKHDSDKKANQMHENVVKEFISKLNNEKNSPTA